MQDLEQAQQKITSATMGAGTSAANSAATSASAVTGFAGLISSRRSSSAEGGSGRTLGSAAEEAVDTRSKKLEQRIDEIMLQADINNDGVIRYASIRASTNGILISCVYNVILTVLYCTIYIYLLLFNEQLQ